MSTNIYMAGKIGKNDWRHELIARDNESRMLRDSKGPFDFSVGRHTLTYRGPFFASCDHGCLHGSTEHGLGLSGTSLCDSGQGLEAWEENGAIAFAHNASDRTKVFTHCMAAIDRCDVVFCHIEDQTCFGTLFELGAAFNAGKPVVLNFRDAQLVPDLWFIREAASCVSIARDPYYALQRWLNEQSKDGR